GARPVRNPQGSCPAHRREFHSPTVSIKNRISLQPGRSVEQARWEPGLPFPSIVLVAAVAENGVIGQGGRLPWRLKSDLAHFRAVTLGKPVVMGRRTYASIGKPLAGRTNIVVSRDPDFAAPGVPGAPTLQAGLAAAPAHTPRRGPPPV